MNIEEFVFYTNQASATDDLFAIYKKAMEGLGFDRLVLTLVTDHPTLKKEAQEGIATSFPDDWINHYFTQDYGSIDPVKNQAFIKNNVFTWDAIKKTTPLSKKQKLLLRESEEAHLHQGLGIPLRGGGGAVAVLGIASSEKDTDINSLILDKINIMGYQFYTCYCRLMEKEPITNLAMLTDKEQEILKWSARGHTQAEVGEKLNISVHTVDYHIRNILMKLGARNITSAVVIALNRGLIQI